MTKEDSKQETAQEQDNSFKLIVKLPNDQEMDFVVVPTTTIQEIKQVVYDSPKAQFLTCFYLSHKQQRLQEVQELGSISDFEPVLEVCPDVYSEHDTRVHVNRFREALNQYKPPVTCYGIDQGCSYASAIGGQSLLDTKEHDLEKEKKEKVSLKETEINGNLQDRIPAMPAEEIVCLQSIGLSVWNPPPLSQKLRGDYLYLFVDTLEKKHLEIVCSQKGFSVSKSTLKAFHPSTEKSYPTLPGLISAYSPLFKKNFEKLNEDLNSRHPFEFYMANYPAHPWLVQPREHKPDAGKSLDLYLQSSEVVDTLCSRDWNDDIQSAHELPKEVAQERILRDQAIYRSHSDFVEAAVRGAIGIVHKTIQPLNPNEDELSQMYIHNNIFFSEGYENKEQFDKYGGPAAAHVAVSKDIDGIGMVESLEVDGIHTLGTVMVDYKGRRIVCQTIVPGILKKAGSNESTIQYGSVDGGLEILSSPEFEEDVARIAKLLHLEKHTVVDQEGKEHSLSTSVETKWVQGTDSRRYVLDLYRLNPIDAFFLDSLEKESDNPYPHQMVLLRPELVNAFYQHKFRMALKAHQEKVKEKGEDAAKEEFQFKLNLNPDAFTTLNLGTDKEVIKKDEEAVREAAGFIAVAISQLTLDAVQYSSTLPLETDQLTSFFHKRGINMRYLGKVAGMFDQLAEPRLAHFKHLLREEMASRALKHVLREQLAKAPVYQSGDVISDIFNLILAIKNGTKYTPTVCDFTPDALKAQVHADVKTRFRYDLGQEYWGYVGPTLFRALCLKVGIQILARQYDFGTTTFKSDDILNVYPIIKHAQPRAGFAVEAFEHGRVSLLQNQKELGVALIRESVSIYEQVYGPIHKDTARAYSNLAALYYEDDKPKMDLAMQRRAVIAHERTYGVDHPETLRHYLVLGTYEASEGSVNVAIKYLLHTLNSWKFLSGPFTHPEEPTILANLASFVQMLDRTNETIDILTKAGQLNETFYGTDSLPYINAQELLTRAYFTIDEFRKALSAQQCVYKYFKKHMGEEDEKTKNCAQILKNLTAKAVEVAKRDRKKLNPSK